MSNNSYLPPVVLAQARRPAVGNRRQTPVAPSITIAALQDKLKVAETKIASQELRIAASEQRIAALECLLLPRQSTTTGTSTPRMQRNPEVSREVRASFKAYQKENNGVGVIIADHAVAADFNDNAKQRMAQTAELLEGPAGLSSPLAASVVKRRSRSRANEHLKYQKAKTKKAIKAERYKGKLASRRRELSKRRHATFINNPQAYMNTIMDISVRLMSEEVHIAG
ncbi:hypothetical protein V8B55DRAFT_1409030 [Mucor lusitanicus]